MGTLPQTLEEPTAEGVRLATLARDAGLPLRLFGGVAIWLRCPSAHEPPLDRTYADIDFFTLGRTTGAVSQFLEAHGYVADKLFNALHSASRMLFADPLRRRPVDVIVDRFAMCHTIDLRERLDPGELTISVTDLLLTKLQIVQINEKDVKDILGLLADHPVDRDGPDTIDLGRLNDVTRDDWGLEHTVRNTLEHIGRVASDYSLSDSVAQLVRQRIDTLVAFLDGASKGLRWRLRSQVGARVRWYELPEEVRR